MYDDLISRQAAIDVLYKNYILGRGDLNEVLDHIVERLDKLPSAQPEPCGDVVSRNAIIQKLNTMDRYVSEELRLCDTDKKFPQNEVFIVDDVYEEIVEQLPSAQPDIIRCKDCVHYYTGFPYDRCLITDKYAEEDDFCSWAERRTDDR